MRQLYQHKHQQLQQIHTLTLFNTLQPQVLANETNITELQTQVTTLNTDVDNLMLKTVNMNVINNVTQFSGVTEISSLNVDSTINFTGNVTISSGSSLFCNQISSVSNTIDIGNISSTIYINGVLYLPFQFPNFFSQY